MAIQLKSGGGNAKNSNMRNQNNGAFGSGIMEETPQMREARMKREAETSAAKEALAKKQEEQRLRALAFEQRDAAKRQREDRQREEEEIRNNPKLAAERARRLAAAQAEEEQRARFKAEEEAKIEAERRVQEKKMDQTEALIAAIRAQVEKEKAAKAEAENKNAKTANNTASKSPSGNPKPQFRTISPEELAKLEEKKRMKAAGLQPESAQAESGGGLGGIGNGPTLSNPNGNGPTLSNPNAGQGSLLNNGAGGAGLGIDITNTGGKEASPKAEESTVALNVDEINAAVEKSKTPGEKPHVPVPEPVRVVGGASTIIVGDNDSAGGENEQNEISWVDSGTAPQHVQQEKPKKDSLVDENGDVISVIPVRQRPVEENDVQSAYNIDFDDDDDDMISFGSAGEDAEAKARAEEEARRKAEEEARQRAEEEARRKAEEEARRKAEEEARRKAEEEARRKAEEEARRKAEEEARRRAEEEARRKAEEEARRKAEEEARRKAEEEARRKAEEEARRKAEEEARRKAEEEARRKAEEEARRRAEEEARRKAEEEARRKAEEEARRKAEEEARRKAEEEARRRAEEEARRRAEEEARRRAEEEARRKAEEEARRKAEEEARRKAEEEARRKAEEEARRKAEEEARRRAEEEARRKAEEEARRKAEEEARRKAEEEARRKAEEEARRKAEEEARQREEEARRKAEEEALKYKKLAEEAARKAEEARIALEEAKSHAATGNASAAASTSTGEYALPVGAEQYLGKYLSVNAISDQIIRTMKYIIENPSEPRNIVVLGQYGFGTTTIAEDFARSFYAMGICRNKTIAKIKAGALNRANISDAIGKLQGGCLVVENAGVISNEKLDEIYQIVSNSSNDVIVIMTGQIETLSKIFKDNVVISSQFKHLVQVHRITDMDVFAIAKNHAEKLGYPCDSSAENMLRRRMQEVESGNLDRVLKFVDNAVSKAHNREMSTGDQEHRLISNDFE
ncbi:MAG: hypothetical protein NC300_07535 [Bacteroidales bacterium]|nr:hypothetical protein [Clostridium sp.]MCM1203980.1 hypothetical protein [Bacteroidales bacterium]